MVKKNIEVNQTPIDMFIQGIPKEVTPKAAKPKEDVARISIVATITKKVALQKIAWAQHKTVNKLINQVLNDYIQKHQADIETYNREYKE